MGLLLPTILLSLVAGGRLATKKGEKIIAVTISSSASTLSFLVPLFSLSPLLPPFLVPLPTAGSHHPSPSLLLTSHISHRPLSPLPPHLPSPLTSPLPPVQNDHLHPRPDKKHFLTQGHLFVYETIFTNLPPSSCTSHCTLQYTIMQGTVPE